MLAFSSFLKTITLPLLKHDDKAAVRMPTAGKILTFQKVFASKFSPIVDVYDVADRV